MNANACTKKMTTICVVILLVSFFFIVPALAGQVDFDNPPKPRPNDPRIELQQIFDANGVGYDWKIYVYDPVSKKRQELEADELERTYRITDKKKENIWTVTVRLYNLLDRLEPEPKGLRVCLKDIDYPEGSEKPHLECDISGQLTVALTLECADGEPAISVYDPIFSRRGYYAMAFLPGNGSSNGNGGRYSQLKVSTLSDCRNCVYIENSAFTHPDRAGGPDVASHSDRTLFANKEIINEVRIYHGSQNPLNGETSGYAFVWQGGRTNPAISLFRDRSKEDGNFGVVFTIPKGFVYPNVDGVMKRTAGLATFLRDTEEDDDDGDSGPPPPPPVTP